MDKFSVTESEFTNLMGLKQKVLTELRVATFCRVTSVNTSNKTINARPVVKEKIKTKNGYEYITLPELLNIPYFTNGVTPGVGDFCVCIHLDRGIYKLINEGIDNVEYVNSDGSLHNMGNCVAFVGFLK